MTQKGGIGKGEVKVTGTRKTLVLKKGKASTGRIPKDINLRNYWGTPYNKYNIFRTKPTGKRKRVGRMMAPNDRVALLKAKYNFRETIAGGCRIEVERRIQEKKKTKEGF